MPRIQPLNHRELRVARQIHGLLTLAYAREARLVGLHGQAYAARSAEDIQSSNEFYLGAFEGDALVGATSVGADDESNQVSIASLYVHPRYQRQGIGSSLVAEALRRGGAMAFSVCAAAKNSAALALYRSLGFVEYRQGTMGPERLAMVKLRRDAPNPSLERTSTGEALGPRGSQA